MGRKAISEATRWQIVGLSKNESNSMRKIAELVGVSEKCVRTTLRNYKESGSVKDKKRVGRPEKVSEREKSFISRNFIKEKRQTLRKGTAELNSALNKSISYSTVRRVLMSKDINAQLSIRKPFLSINDKKKRLKWCKERKNWSIEKWSSVIFTDESNYEVLNRKTKFWYWTKKIDNNQFKIVLPKTQGGGGSVGIWGCMNISGTGISQIYEGRLNQYRYKDILIDNLPPSIDLFSLADDYIYQQDNASCHTAASITDYFEENNINCMTWPARSPDLNPIEHLWVWIDQKLHERQIKNIDQLKQAITETWLNIPIELCRKLVESMPKRINACIKAKGGHIKY